MKPDLFNALINECNAAREISLAEGLEAFNATERMIEGLASVLHRHFDKSFNHEEFIRKTGINHGFTF